MIDVEGLPIWGGLQVAPPSEARVVVAGFPYDESATYRRGDLELGSSVATGWETAAARLAEVRPGAFLTALGGDHCSAIRGRPCGR